MGETKILLKNPACQTFHIRFMYKYITWNQITLHNGYGHLIFIVYILYFKSL